MRDIKFLIKSKDSGGSSSSVKGGCGNQFNGFSGSGLALTKLLSAVLGREGLKV